MKDHQVTIKYEHIVENNLTSNHFSHAQGIPPQTFQTMNIVDETWAVEVAEATLLHSVKAHVYTVTGG